MTNRIIKQLLLSNIVIPRKQIGSCLRLTSKNEKIPEKGP